MLEISLIFVGVTLVLNGLIPILKANGKAPVVLNLLVGGMLIVFNLYAAITVTDKTKLIGFMGGLLFGFTNILIATDEVLKSDKLHTSFYCLLGTVAALCISLFNFYHAHMTLGILWILWMTIWLAAFIGGIVPKLEKTKNIMFIAHGIASTFAVGMLAITGLIII